MGETNNKPHLGMVMRLVELIDSWKKLGILIVLLSFLGGGYLLYNSHKEIVFWVLDVYGKPRIDKDKIDHEAVLLVRDTQAVSIVVWEMDLEKNHRVETYRWVNGVRIEERVGTGNVILRHHSVLTERLIDLLNDDTTCFNIHSLSGTDIDQGVAGVTYVCAVSIPPHHRSMIGVIAIGFKDPPKNEEYIRKRLQLASERLIR